MFFRRIETTNNLQMKDFWKICGLDTSRHVHAELLDHRGLVEIKNCQVVSKSSMPQDQLIIPN